MTYTEKGIVVGDLRKYLGHNNLKPMSIFEIDICQLRVSVFQN